MKRTLKNLILIIMLAAMAFLNYSTVQNAANRQPLPSQNEQTEMPSAVQNMPADNEGVINNNPPSEIPDKDMNSENDKTPPEIPSGESRSNSGEMPNSNAENMQQTGERKGNISVLYYAAFLAENLVLAVLAVYIIMSVFNKKTFKETFKNSDKMIIYVLSIVLLAAGLTIAEGYYAKQHNQINIIQESTTEKKTKKDAVDEGEVISENVIDLSRHTSNISISEAGEYTLTGEFSHTVLINARGEVTLNLNGVNINCADNAAIANISKHELIINLADGTSNRLSDGGSSEYDACIFSEGNLTIAGNGSLEVYGNQNEGEGIATDEKDILINGGIIYIESADDGINAGGDGAEIRINNGNVFIKANGDGIDSNENIVINGGTVYAMGSPKGGDAGLDSDSGITINGGTVIALGSDMLETPQSSSKQNSICFNFDSVIKSGETIALVNDKNETVVCFTAKEDFRTLIISSADLENGKYRLYQGGTSNGTEDNGIYASGEYTGGTEIKVNNQTEFETAGTVTKIPQKASSKK